MISIITPTYNNPEQLRAFLESVRDLDYPLNALEVIVVDDGSDMDAGGVVKDFEFVKFVKLQKHLGPAAARNKGAQVSKGEYLIFFDSDVILKPDTIKLFDESFKSGELAVTGEYDTKPLDDSFFSRFKVLINESWKPNGKYISVFVLRAAGIRKDVFQKVGGFNENIKGASIEDYEFGDRLRKIGVRILFNTDILVRHHHPSYIKQVKVFYLRARDWANLFIERRGRLDNYCASPHEGLGNIFGMFFIVFIILYAVTKSEITAILSVISICMFLFFNLKFIKVARKRRGALFVPLALFIKWTLGIPIIVGFGVGIANRMIKGKPKH